jgi:hypothetical protein
MSVGAWEPCWLGATDRPLYAGLHRPALPSARCGVLLAPPLLHEQPRSRRFLVEVASGLAALGLPCLRFDFFGTGDSAGGGEQLDFATMRADFDIAAEALRARAGVARVCVLAARGAALPLFAWLGAGGAPARVVLWEPIVDGLGWLNELEREDALERRSPKRYPLGRGIQVVNGDDQLMGYPVSQRLRRDIAEAAPQGDPGLPLWAVLRRDARTLPIRLERVFTLPADAPAIGGATRMDATVFVSPRVQRVVDELGGALREEA